MCRFPFTENERTKAVTKRESFNGKPYAGNPHVWFDEGEAASTATSRRGSLLNAASPPLHRHSLECEFVLW